MLAELYIENLAVIEQATVTFCGNFNVFTGETGAGKSVLIDGINAILGKRVSKEIVRNGAEKAVISGLICNISEDVLLKINELGVECVENEILLTREIFADGGSIARINSKTTSVGVLREIGSLLVDIYGQHDSQLLLHPENHIKIVDEFAEIIPDISKYNAVFKEVQEISRKIKKIKSQKNENLINIDRLERIVSEISDVNIKDSSEDESVESEYNLIKNSKFILDNIVNSRSILDGYDSSGGIISEIRDVKNYLNLVKKYDSSIENLIERLKITEIELTDINEELSFYSNSMNFDESKCKFLESRYDALNSIKKKYGPSLSDVLELFEKSKLELESISDADDELEDLSQNREKMLVELTKLADNLSAKRVKAAKQLSKNIQKELVFLDMPKVKFEFKHCLGKLAINGMDSLEMVISVNDGSELMPISKVASGGELSRIMLAIKNVIALKDNVSTLIFDEIDTGVSGRAAQKIGVKLSQISKLRQVICVTHLSQIAVMADQQFLIEKNSLGGKTYTNISRLAEKERICEIARIQCGDNITEIALKNAEEQLQSRDNIYNEYINNK